MQINGIDVSVYQGVINWDKVKGSGIKFAMIRAGWSHYNGGLTVDKNFHSNIKGATAAGVDVGVYIYSYDRSVAGAIISAKAAIELLKPYKLTYPVAYDIEYEEWNVTVGKGKLNTDITISFLTEIEKAGYHPMVYASKDFYSSNLEQSRLTAYDKWVAQYAEVCTYKSPFAMWQRSSTGKVDGINGNVDLNYCYVDYPAMLGGSEPTVPPTDKPKYLLVGGFDEGNMEVADALSVLLKRANVYHEWRQGIKWASNGYAPQLI